MWEAFPRMTGRSQAAQVIRAMFFILSSSPAKMGCRSQDWPDAKNRSSLSGSALAFGSGRRSVAEPQVVPSRGQPAQLFAGTAVFRAGSGVAFGLWRGSSSILSWFGPGSGSVGAVFPGVLAPRAGVGSAANALNGVSGPLFPARGLFLWSGNEPSYSAAPGDFVAGVRCSSTFSSASGIRVVPGQPSR